MGGAIQYVYRDGQRLTPWMLYCINRFSDALFAKFGVRIRVSSGIRTHQEQIDIFLRRYTTNPGGRKVYDTRVWQGRRYYRIDSVGTVAAPGTSNHEIQGSRGAADLADTGADAGIATGNNPRANWARANAHLYGLHPEGYNFREPWHFSIADIFRAPPAEPAGGNSRPVSIPETKNLFTEEEMTASFINIQGKGGSHRAGVFAIMRGNNGVLFAQRLSYDSANPDYPTLDSALLDAWRGVMPIQGL